MGHKSKSIWPKTVKFVGRKFLLGEYGLSGFPKWGGGARQRAFCCAFHVFSRGTHDRGVVEHLAHESAQFVPLVAHHRKWRVGLLCFCSASAEEFTAQSELVGQSTERPNVVGGRSRHVVGSRSFFAHDESFALNRNVTGIDRTVNFALRVELTELAGNVAEHQPECAFVGIAGYGQCGYGSVCGVRHGRRGECANVQMCECANDGRFGARWALMGLMGINGLNGQDGLSGPCGQFSTARKPARSRCVRCRACRSPKSLPRKQPWHPCGP